MDLHYLIAHHFLEYLITISSFVVVVTRFRTELRVIYYAFQAVITIASLAKIYFKHNPNREKKFENFMFGMMNHYLTTHKEGKKLAKDSDIDEKIIKYMDKRNLKHDSEVDGIG